VEGFNTPVIRDLAKALSCFGVKFASLKLLRRCLLKRKVAEETVQEIFEPLEELWTLRSSKVAHHGGAAPKQELKQQYRQLLERCDRSMRLLAELVENQVLDIRETQGRR
jgi:hypothetical protein